MILSPIVNALVSWLCGPLIGKAPSEEDKKDEQEQKQSNPAPEVPVRRIFRRRRK